MRRLGYGRYGAHGNDAGAVISPRLALVDAGHLVGVHLTAGLGIPLGDPAELEGLSDAERESVAGLAALFAGGSGYGPYLANRPQTLAYGLHDSPVAQLAYLVERFKEFDGWDSAEGPDDYLDRDQLLTNATLYWLTGTAGSSSWTYYEGAAGLPVDQDWCRPASPTLARASAAWPSARTASCAGRRTTAAATWWPWPSRRCSWATSGSSSARCAERPVPPEAGPPGAPGTGDSGAEGTAGGGVQGLRALAGGRTRR